MDAGPATEGIRSATRQAENYKFGTFWKGGLLSPFEQACLNSFSARNYDVTVFSFEAISNLPSGIRAADAGDIVSPDSVDAFIYDGKPNLGHFSDYFRYAMIEKANLVWIDADIVYLDNPSTSWLRGDLFGREKANTINGAILYLSAPGLISTLRRDVEKLMHKELTWGETGPLLLQSVLNRAGIDSDALDCDILYPIHHDDIGKAFLAEYMDWCESACVNAATLHVFNNVISRMGYWKMMAPPVGSYLHGCFEESDGLRFFSSTFPESVMKRVVHNFRMSQTGQELGMKSVLREFVPSFVRSFKHHSKCLTEN